jgi:hypothetical protein
MYALPICGPAGVPARPAVVMTLWSGIKNVLTVAQLADLAHKAATLLGPLVT